MKFGIKLVALLTTCSYLRTKQNIIMVNTKQIFIMILNVSVYQLY